MSASSKDAARKQAARGGATTLLRAMAIAIAVLGLGEALDVQLVGHAGVLSGGDRALMGLAFAGPQALIGLLVVAIELVVVLIVSRLRPQWIEAALSFQPTPSPRALGVTAAAVVFFALSWLKEYRFELHYIANAYDAVDDTAIVMTTLNVALTVVVALVAAGCGRAVWHFANLEDAQRRGRWLRGGLLLTWCALALSAYLFLSRQGQFLPPYARAVGGIFLMVTVQGAVALFWPSRSTRRDNLVTLGAFVVLLACLRLSTSPFLALREVTYLRASHAGISLALVGNLTDLDGDGVPAFLGGADCDDVNVDIHPTALDAPGDGIDQNCTGADAAMRPGVGAFPLATTPKLKPAEKWSFIWIIVDALRYDRIGRVVDGTPLTPSLSALGESSVVFEKARSSSTHTMESFATMLSGRYPTYLLHRGEHVNLGAMLAPQLAANDWSTTFLTPVTTFKAYTPLTAAGFMRFDDQFASGKDFLYAQTSRLMTDAAITLLERAKGPLFAVVHYFDPHAQYLGHPDFPFGDTDLDLYDAEVAFTDRQIGRLFAYLNESGWSERTVLVVTSDHGEAFGEHGVTGHGGIPYEEVLRVPLFIRVPGIAPRVVEQPVVLIDLMPTMLHLAGAPDPGHLQGKSLVPLMTGADEPSEPRFFEVNTRYDPWRAVIDGDLKYILGLRNNVAALYDLSADPNERHNLVGTHERSAELRAAIDTFRDDWLHAAPFAEPLLEP